jgi:hypothetical protein
MSEIDRSKGSVSARVGASMALLCSLWWSMLLS